MTMTDYSLCELWNIRINSFLWRSVTFWSCFLPTTCVAFWKLSLSLKVFFSLCISQIPQWFRQSVLCVNSELQFLFWFTCCVFFHYPKQSPLLCQSRVCPSRPHFRAPFVPKYFCLSLLSLFPLVSLKKSLQFPVVARLLSSGHTQKQLCTLLLIKVYSLFFGCVKQIKQEEETHCYSRRLPGDGESTLRAAYSQAFIYSCLLCLCLSCLPVPIWLFTAPQQDTRKTANEKIKGAMAFRAFDAPRWK